MIITLDSVRTTSLAVQGPNEALYVTAAGGIQTSAATALSLKDTNAELLGFVRNTADTGEAVLVENGTLVLDAGAEVTGSNNGVIAYGAEIVNAGTITADRFGVYSLSNLPLKITNSGTIVGSAEAVRNNGGLIEIDNSGTITGRGVVHGVDATLSITNHGLLEGYNLVLDNFGSGNDIIRNFGRIEATSTYGLVQAIYLAEGNDLYEGHGGSTVIGMINMGAGDDTVSGGTGNETFEGGQGTDTFTYAGANAITLDLSLATAQITGNGTDTLLSFENAWTGDGADRLIGSDAANLLIGGGGNDTLLGGKGNDILKGGENNNILEGGEGADTLDGSGGASVASYQHAAAGLRVDFSDEAHNTGEAAGDHFVNLTAALGSAFNDTLLGNHAANWMVGERGADTLSGAGGADSLYGAEGDDVLDGGPGDDYLDGGAGANTARFAGAAADYTITHDTDGSVTVEGREGRDSLLHVQTLLFADGEQPINRAPYDLVLSKATVAEDTPVTTIVASLSALDPEGDALGFRLLPGSDAAFAIDGNSLVLIKALDYEAHQELTLHIEASDHQGGTVERTFTIAVTDVAEASDPGKTPSDPTNPDPSNPIPGSGSSTTGPARPLDLWGTPRADALRGDAANDILHGMGGNDALAGLGGNDRLYGGAGKDLLTGGAGLDIFVFGAKAMRANVDRITDFSVPEDTVHLAKGVFKALSKKGILKAGEFHIGAGAHDGDDHVIYHRRSGKLSYDADGTGGQASVQIATLSKNLELTEKDFYVI